MLYSAPMDAGAARGAENLLNPEDGLPAPVRKIIAGVIVFSVVCLVAVSGYVAAGWAVDDAIYMVIITIFGVGFSEVRPVDTWALRALTIGVIIVGYGAVIYTIGGFIQLVVDGELNRVLGARKMTREIDQLQNHAVICGFGRMGRELAQSLSDAGKPFVVIDSNPDVVAAAETRKYLALLGDASQEQVLLDAGLIRADVMATVLPDDASNVFVTLTARSMCPDLLVLARGENPTTVSKLGRCGADHIVLPAAIGATKMSQLILRPSADELLDHLDTTAPGEGIDVLRFGLEFDQVEINADSPLAGRTLREMEVRGALGYLVVGLRTSDGQTHLHPSADTILSVGDTVVLLGYEDDMLEIAASAKPQAQFMYRGNRTTNGESNGS